MHKLDNAPAWLWPSLLLLLIAAPLFSITQGAIALDLGQVWGALVEPTQQGLSQSVVWQLRLPRVVMAMIAGAALASAGFVLQSVTRNPLADPYLFGISSGASFGAVVTITGAFGASVWWLPAGAFAGAVLAIGLVLGLMGQAGYRQAERMLLAGVAVSFLFSALSAGLIYGADTNAIASVLFWNMGSVARVEWSQLWLPSSALVIALGWFLWQRRAIEAMACGDEAAHTLGVRVRRVRVQALLMAALVTSAVVALCGGIGFVGLVVPHLVRLMNRGFGWRLSWLQHLLCSVGLGAIFLVLVDTLARLLLPAQELPLGVITASIGSIFFIYLLGRVRH
ncbi:FecCD family ABC transporter permease [Paraferrimonas sedimenticola]|uniref:ABC transporter permease n=1 Tax=Paraferrimonas sedimenticola TaxID=375674 RepID=A0AA37W078_9GAMM|nr:iron ABC transporter permease [Paraferrimonas sedimenticola]GLP98126.1 ABC transporter permease [Paraferrimonas sedimenticola]